MVEGILALGAGRLVSLGLSARDTGKFQHVCIFSSVFVLPVAGCSLTS